MKNILLAFVLLFNLSSEPLLESADASREPVVDISGKKLRAGANYYIVPAVRGFTRCGKYECLSAEGLSLASIGESCPLDVVVVPRSHGLPLSFSPVDSNERVVRVSTDMNIVFSTDHTSCAEYSPVWKLDHFGGGFQGHWFVTTGGSMGNHGWETIRNWFKIEKCDDGNYKIVYCPSVLPFSKRMCKDVGVFVDQNGYRRLALSDVPFKVKFQLV